MGLWGPRGVGGPRGAAPEGAVWWCSAAAAGMAREHAPSAGGPRGSARLVTWAPSMPRPAPYTYIYGATYAGYGSTNATRTDVRPDVLEPSREVPAIDLQLVTWRADESRIDSSAPHFKPATGESVRPHIEQRRALWRA